MNINKVKENKTENKKENKKDCKKEKQKIIISCFYNSGNSDLPVGFGWAQTLLEQYYKDYKVTILLHGLNISYGLNNKVYKQTYKLDNPYIAFFSKMVKKYGLRIVICDLCLKKGGFNNKQLLPFVRPIPFSIDYIAKAEKDGKTVIYDAKL